MISSFLRWAVYISAYITHQIPHWGTLELNKLWYSSHCQAHMFSSPGAHECCSLCSSPTSWLLWLGGVCSHFWPSGLGVGVISVTCTSEHLIVGARVFRAFSFIWSNDFQCSRRCWLTSCSSWVPEWFCWVESFSDVLWSTCTLNQKETFIVLRHWDPGFFVITII